MSNRDIGIRALIPGQRSPEEIKEDENNRRYVETVVNQSLQRRPREVPLGETLMMTTPSLHLELKPKEETKKESLDDILKHQAKGAEMVRKARQNPEWVAEHNKRFGRISKTTVLPKDKGPNEKTIQQLKALKEHHYPKSKPMPVNTYVDKMNVLYSGQEKRKVDDQGTPIKESKGSYIPWYDRMAQEEAEHLNSIKRETWKNGGSVGPEPKYVSTQDVQKVYDQPKASPVQMKQLHKRLQNHNQRTGEFKNLPKEEELHPYEKGIEEDLQKIDDKGKSWFSKHLKKIKW